MSTRDALNGSSLPADELDGLCQIYGVLSHPLRVRVLLTIDERKQSSAKLISDELDAKLGDVSYHMSFLRDRGYLRGVRDIQRRGAIEHVVALTPRAQAALALVALDVQARRA